MIMESIEQQLAHLPEGNKVPSKKHQYGFKNMILKTDASVPTSPLKKATVMNNALWDVWRVLRSNH
jgi:hypothetical protein